MAGARVGDEHDAEVRVVIAVADPKERVELVDALQRFGVVVVGCAATSDGVERAMHDRRPDAVLVDLALPGRPLRAIARMCAVRPATAIVAVGAADSHRDFLAAVTAGALGYVSPEVGTEALVRVLRGVVRGETAFPRAMSALLAEALREGRPRLRTARCPSGVELTEREWDVLRLLWQGCTSAEIARELTMTEATARSHVANILHRLGVEHREDLLDVLAQDW